MNCPVCKSTELAPNELEPQLTSLKCAQCEGNFVRGAQYWKWLENHGPNLPEREADIQGLDLTETLDPLDCPECRWRMVKYLIGRGTGFSLDHCQGCKGIWLDRNEWETLRSRNLHDDLNSVLTSFWQAEANKEERRKRAEERYVRTLGAEDYAELKRVRTWLEQHERKHELIAYLTSRDPLEI